MSKSEDFAVKVPLREVEAGRAKLKELLIAKAATMWAADIIALDYNSKNKVNVWVFTDTFKQSNK